LSHTSNPTLYKKLYDDILQNIKAKKFIDTNRLPSENELSKEYGINRHTVRHALGLLKEDGYIYTKKGVGNFVSTIEIPYSITGKSSYSSKILDLGYTPKTQLLSANIIEADKSIAENLNLPIGFSVIELKLLRFANGLPIQISYSYFDSFSYREILKNLEHKPFSLYGILKHCYPDLKITKVATNFSSLLSSSEHRKLLGISKNSPILVAKTISKDQNGFLVEYGVSYFRGDICSVKINLIEEEI